MARPPIRAKEFRDGFYLEIRNKGSKVGIKIIRDTKQEMLNAIKQYRKNKEVIVLGESRNGKWVESDITAD